MFLLFMRWSSHQLTYERNMNYKVNEQAGSLKQNKLKRWVQLFFYGIE